MATTYFAVISLATISGLTTLIGAGLALCCRRNYKIISFGIGFSAGIMLLISLFELIPESVNEAGILKTFISVLLGAILIMILNIIIPHTHLIKERQEISSHSLKVAYLVAFGLILHDFPEGFAMANSYIINPNLGILIAIAIALHNIPEEFAMSIPIIFAQKKKSFLFKIAFVSGLAEPAGALIGLLATSLIPSLTPLFMSFAAGAMAFIALHELYPMAKKSGYIRLFVLGTIASIIVYLLLTTFLPE